MHNSLTREAWKKQPAGGSEHHHLLQLYHL